MTLEAITKAFADYINPSTGTITGRDVQKNIRDFVEKFVASVSDDRVRVVAKMDESARQLMSTLLADKIRTISNPVELEKFFKAFIDSVGLKYDGLEKIFGLMRDLARGIQGEGSQAKLDNFLNRISILTGVFNEAVEKILGHKGALPQVAQTALKDAKFEQVHLKIDQMVPAEAQQIAEELGIGQAIQLKMGNVDVATLEGARKLLLAIQQKLTPSQLAMFIDELTTGKITLESFLRIAKEEELKKKFKTKDKLLARVLESAVEEINQNNQEEKDRQDKE